MRFPSVCIEMPRAFCPAVFELHIGPDGPYTTKLPSFWNSALYCPFWDVSLSPPLSILPLNNLSVTVGVTGTGKWGLGSFTIQIESISAPA